jgi:methionyl aminopeptidase
MAIIRTQEDLQNLRYSCRILASCHYHIAKLIKAGADCGQIDKFADSFIRKYQGVPSFTNYQGYKYSTCISINDEVVHGIAPSGKIIPDKSIVSVDMGVKYKGMFADCARSYIVGEVDQNVQLLRDTADEALNQGIKAVKAGARIGDIGYAIQSYVDKFGFGNLEDYGGHGVGYAIHEPPFIPHQGKKNTGPRLFENQVICIEPMLTIGSNEVYVDPKDKWTVKTVDGSLAAHSEDEILVTKNGYEILTRIEEKDVLPV